MAIIHGQFREARRDLVKGIVPAVALFGNKAPFIEIIDPGPRVSRQFHIRHIAGGIHKTPELPNGDRGFADPVGR